MVDEKPITLKLMTRKDFEAVRDKYTPITEQINSLIENAGQMDVLALSVSPGSGLKILDVKVFNENKQDVFLEILKQGAVGSP